MLTYQLYIGSNNITHEVDKPIITSVLSKYFDGITMVDSLGYWKGKPEYSVIVTIVSDKKTLMTVLSELKDRLAQDAIAYQLVPQLKFY